MQPEMEREVSLTWKGRSSKRIGRGRRRAGAFAALAIAFAVARAPDVAHAQAADVLSAQASPAGPVRELTLDQALVLAKRANKNLVVERARLAAGAHQHRAGLGGAVPGGDRAREVHPQLQERDARLRRVALGLPASSNPGMTTGGYDSHHPQGEPVRRRRQRQHAAHRAGRLPGARRGEEGLRLVGGELRGVRGHHPLHGRADVLRGGRLRRGAAGPRARPSTWRRRRWTTRRPASPPARSPRSTSTAPSWRWCAPSRASSTPVRARAVVPRARHADPGRRAVQGRCRPRRCRRTTQADLDMALHLRPEFRGLILSAESSDAQKPRLRLEVGPHAVGVRQGAPRQLRRLHRRQLRLVGRGAARLDAVRRRHPGRAAPPGGRAGGAGRGAGRRAHATRSATTSPTTAACSTPGARR